MEYKYPDTLNKKQFVRNYRRLEEKCKLYLLLKNMNLSLVKLGFWVHVVYLFRLDPNIVTILSFLFGFVYAHLTFGYYHVMSHALMLNYAFFYKPCTEIRVLVNYFAFYHHHSKEEDDWFPEINYNTVEGTNNLFLVHFIDFGLWSSVVFNLGFVYALQFHSVLMYMLLGYRVGTYFIVWGHDYVHKKRYKNYMFEKLMIDWVLHKLFAHRKDHLEHHKTNKPYVYSSFTSSGIYLPLLDKRLDTLWRSNFSYGWASIYYYTLIEHSLLTAGVLVCAFYIGC